MMHVGMKLDEFKKLFFDEKKVLDATDRARQRVLSRFGAYVRTAARSSIRVRKRISSPGQPPSSHIARGTYSGHGASRMSEQGIRAIYFGYDKTRRSVVVGPVLLSALGKYILPALEYGGPSQVIGGGQRKRKVVRRITIRARPFMQPAFEKEQKKLPALWANSIR